MASDVHLMSCLNCGHEISEDARFCGRCGAPQTDRSRDGGLAVLRSAPLTGNPYLRALRRFWWVLVVGIGIAAIAAISAVYRIEPGVPLSLEKRDQVTYTSSSRLLVTSAEEPYIRTSVTREVSDGEAVQEYTAAPDISTLISAANLYPILIESDQVEELRQDMFGPLPGAITARAIYELNTPSRFELSQVPVIEVFGTADTAAGAVQITRSTVDAFLEYVERTQNQSNLSRQERILLDEIERPEGAVASGGSSLSLPLMLFVLVSAGFFVLAILLDRLLPGGLVLGRRGRRTPQPIPEEAELLEPSADPGRPARRRKARV